MEPPKFDPTGMFSSGVADQFMRGGDPRLVEMLFRHDEVIKNIVITQTGQSTMLADILKRVNEIDSRIQSSLLKITSGVVASLLVGMILFVLSFSIN